MITLLTIGYGNISPKTTGGRIFLFVYFVAGAINIGYFLSSIQDYAVEKADQEVKRMERWRKIRADIRQNKREERIRTHDEFSRHFRTFFTSSIDPTDDSVDNDKEVDVEEIAEPLDVELTVGGSKSGSEPSTIEKGFNSGIEADMAADQRMQKRFESIKFRRTMVAFIAWWLISSAIFHRLEPTWTYLDATYFTFCTFTTIGYGDLYPTTPWSWEFLQLFIFVSIASFSVLIGVLTESVGTRIAQSALRVQLRVEERKERADGGVRQGRSRRRSLLSNAMRVPVIVEEGERTPENAEDWLDQVFVDSSNLTEEVVRDEAAEDKQQK
ncbi:Potassium channel sub K member 9, partial [Dinochytrium kinnereticum]